MLWLLGHQSWSFSMRLILGGEKPKKIEEISIDKMRAISFTESRDVKGGIEVGLALTKAKMDAFTMFFSENLDVLRLKKNKLYLFCLLKSQH